MTYSLVVTVPVYLNEAQTVGQQTAISINSLYVPFAIEKRDCVLWSTLRLSCHYRCCRFLAGMLLAEPFPIINAYSY